MPHRLTLTVPNTPNALHALADLMARVPNFGDLADIQHVSGDAPAPAAADGIQPRFRRVKWAKHHNKRTGKKWWTATLNGHPLRVDWVKTADAGIAFDGYADNAFVIRGKQLEAVRQRVENDARTRSQIPG